MRGEVTWSKDVLLLEAWERLLQVRSEHQLQKINTQAMAKISQEDARNYLVD